MTANAYDAQAAIDAGVPAAVLLTDNIPKYYDSAKGEIRIAFDGDAVIFSEDSELIYKKEGLAQFAENERNSADIPMKKGPFAKFLGNRSTTTPLSKLKKS